MRFEGSVWREKASKLWIAEVPMLDLTTQGKSRENALEMIVDALQTLAGQRGFKANARFLGAETFTLGANDEGSLIALMLKRQREAHHLTLMEVARRLSSKSPNAYARYEQGKSVPSIQKLNELMKAIDPSFEPILKVA